MNHRTNHRYKLRRNCLNHRHSCSMNRNHLPMIRYSRSTGMHYLQVRRFPSAPEKSTKRPNPGATGHASCRSGKNRDADCRDPK